MLLKGLGEGGVERHVGLVVTQVAELHQQTVLGVELTVAWHQHRGQHWESSKTEQPGHMQTQ